jgi:hypothetical protein
MNLKTSFIASTMRLAGLAALVACAGCRSPGALFGPACADIPKGAIPQPSGTYTCQWQAAQAGRAELDDFVVYVNEWLEKSAVLAPCGKAHVDVMAHRLETMPVQVVIQSSPDPELDQARRATVIELLASKGIPDVENVVTIGCPEAEGLYGFEAPRIIRGYSQSGTFGAGTGGRGVGFGGGMGGFGSGYGGGGFNIGGFF